MENRINTLFYNFLAKDILHYNEEIKKLGYFLKHKNITKLEEAKQEIINSEFDLIVIDEGEVKNKLEKILNKLNELNSRLSILVVTDKITPDLIIRLNKVRINDIVSKSGLNEICLALIRNFEKTKIQEQFDFTKKELLRSQKTQTEHDHFLNQIIESTSNPIFYKGTEGRYFGCNTAFAEFIGLPKEEIIGKTVFDVSPKELAQKYYEMDQEFFKNPVTQQYEYKVANANGSIMDVIFYKTAIRDDQDNVVGLLGHMFDITERKKLEEEIKKGKEIADFILDTSSRIHITLDLNGNITSVNRKACEILELTKDQLIGKNWFDNFLPDEDVEKVREVFKGIIEDTVSITEKVEGVVQSATKKQKNIVWENRQIRDSEGNITGTLSSGKEVIKDDQLEKQLQMTQRKYQTLVENMHEGVGIVDLNEVVIFSNPSFDKMFGFEAGGMIGKDLKDFIQKEDLEKVFEETKKRKEDKSSQYKIGIIRKDGKHRIINLSSVPWKNDQGEIVGTIGMVMDITAEEHFTKRLEKKVMIEQSIITISSQFISTENFETKLENALNELHKIIEAERYGILTIKNDKLNLAIERHYDESSINGISFEQVEYNRFEYGLQMLDSLDFIFIDDVSQLPEEAKVEKEIFEKYKIFNFLGIPFYTDSKLEGLLIISNIYEVDEWTIEDLSLIRTISDIIGHAFSRKKAEERAENLNRDIIMKNKELEQVVYVTSHDIRSPVVNILGFSDEMIKALNKLSDKIFQESNKIENKEDVEFLLKKDIPHILNFIKVSGQKIDKLLLALLKLSRLGRAAINKVQVNMNELMSSLISTFEFKIQEEDIRIEVDELPNCFTDEVQINQVFSNLIDNAIKYRSPDRKAVIKITGKEEEDSITYCVEDNGIGISETELEKIFDVFYRINPENQDGEGMGLSLIKKTIDRLGGKISVGSSEGEGTKFYISLEKQRV